MTEEDEYYSDKSSLSSEEEEEDSDYDMDESANESDEELICDRVEVDRGIKYVVKDGPTITRPEIATKTYFKRNKCYPSTFAKFSLDRYNHIEGWMGATTLL